MYRWVLAISATLLAFLPAKAQNSRDITAPGYILIRVILDGGGAATPAVGGYGDGGLGSEGSLGAGGPGAPGEGGLSPGGFGGVQGAPGAGKPNEVSSIYVVAPFRSINFKLFFTDKRFNPETNPSWAAMKTKYGTTYLYHDDTSIQIKPIPADPEKGTGFQASLESGIRDRYRRWSTNRKHDPIYELTVDALALGMIDEAFGYATETVKLVEVLKDDPNKKPSDKIQRFATIWKELSPKLDQDVPVTGSAEDWRSRLSAGAVKQGKHYSMVYWGERQINPLVLERRLNALERNFKAYYLWHALQGIEPALPTKKLVTVLADRVTDMGPLREKLDGLPIHSDAFYSPIHDLIVFSPERIDRLGAAFTDIARTSYKNGWSRDELIRGIPPTGGSKQPPQELARMMTIALVDKLLEEEMDHSTMSREATRQLYVASGIIPRNVQLPSWLESGLGSLLQHPKGPMFSKDSKNNTVMVAGLAHGYGAPNYIQHRRFREMDTKKELNPKPEVLLKNVLMDRYFQAAQIGIDIDPPPPAPPPTAGGSPTRGGGGPVGPGGFGGPPGGRGGLTPGGPGAGAGPGGGSPGAPEEGSSGGFGGPSPMPTTFENVAANLRKSKEQIMQKADATSWALVYYLSRGQMAGLQKFYSELNRMPRDMRLNENVVLNLFCKCFNLMDRQKVNEIDEESFQKFAEMWVRSMRNVPIYGVEISMTDPSANNNNLGGDPAGGGRLPGGVGGRGPGGP